MPRFFCIGDVHGDFLKLCRLMDRIEQEAGFDPTKDVLVQLGDKNDRGPQTFEVFEYFRIHKEMFPATTILIMGNHELMMLAASRSHLAGAMDRNMAESFWISQNGGPMTLASYEGVTGLKAPPYTSYGGYGELRWQSNAGPAFGNMLAMTGHDKVLKEDHVLLHETDEYIFCHAPQRMYYSKDWRESRDGLTWTHGPHNEDWVARDLCGKIAVHGHIHGLSYKGQGKYKVKKVRRYGNSFLVDTGCGCASVAPLSCLVLPDMTVFNSDGETYSLKTQEEIELCR